MNKRTNPETNMVPKAETDGAALTMRNGNTTFFIDLHFSEKSKETLEEKVKKLIKKEVKNDNF